LGKYQNSSIPVMYRREDDLMDADTKTAAVNILRGMLASKCVTIL